MPGKHKIKKQREHAPIKVEIMKLLKSLMGPLKVGGGGGGGGGGVLGKYPLFPPPLGGPETL